MFTRPEFSQPKEQVANKATQSLRSKYIIRIIQKGISIKFSCSEMSMYSSTQSVDRTRDTCNDILHFSSLITSEKVLQRLEGKPRRSRSHPRPHREFSQPKEQVANKATQSLRSKYIIRIIQKGISIKFSCSEMSMYSSTQSVDRTRDTCNDILHFSSLITSEKVLQRLEGKPRRSRSHPHHRRG